MIFIRGFGLEFNLSMFLSKILLRIILDKNRILINNIPEKRLIKKFMSDNNLNL
jgi:hypothetical protein